MPAVTIEVHEVRGRILELLDAALDGKQLVVTRFGETVAVCSLLGYSRDAPRTWLAAVMLELLDEVLEHFRDPVDARLWSLN